MTVGLKAHVMAQLAMVALATVGCTPAGTEVDHEARVGDERPDFPVLTTPFPAAITLPTPSTASSPTPSPKPDEQAPSPILPTLRLTSDAPLTDEPSWMVELEPDGVVVMNADGTGQRLLVPYEPKVFRWGAYDMWFMSAIAPSGWTAARVAPTTDGRADPRLFIFNLPDPSLVAEIPLLADDLRPERVEREIGDGGPETNKDLYLAIHSAGFSAGAEWSPDGTQLAFLAAIDGPSADVYLYDTRTNEVSRLTDGPNQPKLLGWSPDGQWVVHSEITDIRLGDGIFYDNLNLWAAAADGSGSIRVLGEGALLVILEWLTPTSFIAIHHDFGPSPAFGLELIDLHAGKLQSLYTGTAYPVAIDPATGTVAFAPYISGRQFDTLEPGLYIVSPSRPVPAELDLPWPEPADEYDRGALRELRWSSELGVFEFVLPGGPEGTFTTDGVVTLCEEC